MLLLTWVVLSIYWSTVTAVPFQPAPGITEYCSHALDPYTVSLYRDFKHDPSEAAIANCVVPGSHFAYAMCQQFECGPYPPGNVPGQRDSDIFPRDGDKVDESAFAAACNEVTGTLLHPSDDDFEDKREEAEHIAMIYSKNSCW